MGVSDLLRTENPDKRLRMISAARTKSLCKGGPGSLDWASSTWTGLNWSSCKFKGLYAPVLILSSVTDDWCNLLINEVLSGWYSFVIIFIIMEERGIMCQLLHKWQARQCLVSISFPPTQQNMLGTSWTLEISSTKFSINNNLLLQNRLWGKWKDYWILKHSKKVPKKKRTETWLQRAKFLFYITRKLHAHV